LYIFSCHPPIRAVEVTDDDGTVASLELVLDYQTKIEEMSRLVGEWGRLRRDYEDLWRQSESHPDRGSLEDDYKKVREAEANLEKNEVKLPHDEALLKRCQHEVKRAQGLG